MEQKEYENEIDDISNSSDGSDSDGSEEEDDHEDGDKDDDDDTDPGVQISKKLLRLGKVPYHHVELLPPWMVVKQKVNLPLICINNKRMCLLKFRFSLNIPSPNRK